MNFNPSSGFPEFPVRVEPTLEFTDEKSVNELHQYWRSNAFEGYLERFWPGELSHGDWIARIRTVLTQSVPNFANADIEYFAAGTFNRIYKITNPNWPDVYLFRVSIPVEPFFKTESEVATMEYVRRHTSLPIPRVIAFSSSDANELGHEWILMEMLKGVPLRTAWETMSEPTKGRFFTELAGHVKGLLALRFSKFGSIYFSDVADRVVPKDSALPDESANGTKHSDNMDTGIGPDAGFVIGRIVAQDFFFDKRIHFTASRGPFQTTRELIDARVELLSQRIQNLSVNPGDPYYCENDLELANHKDRIHELFDRLKALVPRLVPQENGPEDARVLWHDDLSEHNLLVDPVTYKLTGVIDWEAVSIVPAYETYNGLPAFLSFREFRPMPLTLLVRGGKPDEATELSKKMKDESNMKPIQDAYHKVVGPLYDESCDATRKRVAGKQGLARQLDVAGFQHRPWATEVWMAENGYFNDEVNGGKAAGTAHANGAETETNGTATTTNGTGATA
ncbi:hypothetical protein VTK56DRAFT_4025 [Thermocarpiscus australiensis]